MSSNLGLYSYRLQKIREIHNLSTHNVTLKKILFSQLTCAVQEVALIANTESEFKLRWRENGGGLEAPPRPVIPSPATDQEVIAI